MAVSFKLSGYNTKDVGFRIGFEQYLAADHEPCGQFDMNNV